MRSKKVSQCRPPFQICERRQVVEVPKTLCQESVEVVKNLPQERISERSRSVEVPKISCRESVEAEDLDETGDESLSRREGKLRRRRILRCFSQLEEGTPSCSLDVLALVRCHHRYGVRLRLDSHQNQRQSYSWMPFFSQWTFCWARGNGARRVGFLPQRQTSFDGT